MIRPDANLGPFRFLVLLSALGSTLGCQSSHGQGHPSDRRAAGSIYGMIGVGTWATQAEVKDIRAVDRSLDPSAYSAEVSPTAPVGRIRSIH